ncbi:MAG: DNA primase [Parvibaculaceae bacterium]
MKFSPTFLDEIRARVSASSVVGRRVQWDRRKSNLGRGDFWACCPFHNEKTASFHVDDRKGRYHCFGCKASGDIFTFLTEKEGLPFPEAVERLAQEAGLQMPVASPQEVEREKRRTTLYDVIEFATQFYESKLRSPEGSSALNYLRQRGITDSTLQKFRMGYAPPSRTGLSSFLKSRGISSEQMAAAGLLVTGDDIPEPYDRFRDRIIFPIDDVRGRIIAFGGRAMSKDALAKYLNSPETELFDKGNVLFNLSRARPTAFEQSKIILVEGYMDVVATFQSGIENVVAAMGTALTENHLRQLWRIAPDPVMCFDGDKAGAQAASRSLDRAIPMLTSGHSLRFAFMPKDKDPADLMLEDRKEEFLARLDKAMTAQAYLWSRETDGAKIDTPEQKAGLEAHINEVVSKIADENVRKYYSMKMRISLADFFWQHDRTRRAKSPRGILVLPDEGVVETERKILGLAVEFPHVVFTDIERFQMWEFRLAAHAAFQQELVRLLVEEDVRTVASIYDSIRADFYRVLEQVHGRENPERGLPRGHNLYARFPSARFHPNDEFVLRYFTLLFRHLELEQMVRERDELVERFAKEPSIEVETKLLEIIRNIEETRGRFTALERELVEEAIAIREAYQFSDGTKIAA